MGWDMLPENCLVSVLLQPGSVLIPGPHVTTRGHVDICGLHHLDLLVVVLLRSHNCWGCVDMEGLGCECSEVWDVKVPRINKNIISKMFLKPIVFLL